MKKNILIILIILGTIFFSKNVFGFTNQTIEVVFNKVSLVVNGQVLDKETILYNNTTYIPLRASAEVLDKTVEFDDSSSTAYINDIGISDNFKNIIYSYKTNDFEIEYYWPAGVMHAFPSIDIKSNMVSKKNVLGEIWNSDFEWANNSLRKITGFFVNEEENIFEFTIIYQDLETDVEKKIPVNVDLNTGDAKVLGEMPKKPTNLIWP